VFTRTCGYRDASIPARVEALKAIDMSLRFALDCTKDLTIFATGRLCRYAASIWLSPSGDVLDDPQRRAFAEWVATGHGFIGIHGATACEYGNGRVPKKIVGSRFVQHSAIQPSTMTVEHQDHRSTSHLGETWPRVDEW